MTDTTTMPTRIAAWLVAGHLDRLWQQWATDKDMPGCCTTCCAPCGALKELLDAGQLDDLYGWYVETTGPSDVWDAERGQVGRVWLNEAWSVERGCHEEDSDES